jgi:uncharacterized protein YjbI with pentapeptide repeats
VHLASAIISGTADDINKLLLSLAGIIGVPFLAWRTLLAAEQVSIARESHYTSLFTKATEQLGSTREIRSADPDTGEAMFYTEPNLEVRLGAIYSLERIALDSERDHGPIIETLCAYVRQNAGPPLTAPEGVIPGSREYSSWLTSLPQPRVDVVAAMKILGRRPEHRIAMELKDNALERTPFDLAGVNLQRVRLKNLKLANLDLSGSSFQGAYLMQVDLSKTQLYGCNLIQTVLSACKFDNALAMALDLRNAHIRRTSAKAATLEEANFAGARLYDCDFTKANLEGAKFENSRVRGSIFQDANMTASELGGSNWSKTTLGNANLDSASFASPDERPANFSQALGLTSDQIASAFGTEGVKLPADIQIPTSWTQKNRDLQT